MLLSQNLQAWLQKYQRWDWFFLAGFTVFWSGMFIVPGFPLVGDTYYLGTSVSRLSVTMPLAFIGLGVCFLVQLLRFDVALTKVFKNQKLWLGLSGFVLVQVFLALFATQPLWSLGWTVIWAGAFLILFVPGLFTWDDPFKQVIVFLQLWFFGALGYLEPSLVSKTFLSLTALWFLYQIYLAPCWRQTNLMALLLLLFLAEFAGIGVWIMVFALWITLNHWSSRAQIKLINRPVWAVGILFLLLSLFWIIWKNELNMSLIIPQNWQIWLYGLGEGQYWLRYMQPSSMVLDPSQWQTPWLGINWLLWEKGLIGLGQLSLLFYLLFKNITQDKNLKLFFLLWGCFVMGILGFTAVGILWLIGIGVETKSPQINPLNQSNEKGKS